VCCHLNKRNESKASLRDIDSLTGHTGFIFDKINFLMDALLGMEQPGAKQNYQDFFHRGGGLFFLLPWSPVSME
jgi:hypothetical protein